MTKEELQTTNSILEKQKIKTEEKDTRIREEFAKAFKWYEDKDYYSKIRDLKESTWEEIFVEVGKLLKVVNTQDIREDVEMQKASINDIYDRLNQIPE